jgi:hypothetical protein
MTCTLEPGAALPTVQGLPPQRSCQWEGCRLRMLGQQGSILAVVPQIGLVVVDVSVVHLRAATHMRAVAQADSAEAVLQGIVRGWGVGCGWWFCALVCRKLWENELASTTGSLALADSEDYVCIPGWCCARGLCRIGTRLFVGRHECLCYCRRHGCHSWSGCANSKC